MAKVDRDGNGRRIVPGSGGNPRIDDVGRALRAGLPQIWGQAVGKEGDFTSITIKQRNENDWIAIAKRFNEDGLPEVCFGTGYDYLSVLLGLESSLAKNAWKADKPWGGAK